MDKKKKEMCQCEDCTCDGSCDCTDDNPCSCPNFVTDKKQWKDTIDKFKDRKPQMSETLEYLKDK
jgi:hypothetical protein